VRPIDHIVYAVPHLDTAIDKVEKLLGIRPTIGGRHLSRGTKNALLNLGNRQYLELIAKDSTNTTFKGTAWMSVDTIKQPTMVRWSILSNNLYKDQEILEVHGQRRGPSFRGSRKTPTGQTLAWDMILPSLESKVDIVPFMTDWSSSDTHPTDALPSALELEALICYHPNPSYIQPIFDHLEIDLIIQESDDIAIKARIASPNGIVIL